MRSSQYHAGRAEDILDDPGGKPERMVMAQAHSTLALLAWLQENATHLHAGADPLEAAAAHAESGYLDDTERARPGAVA